MTTLAGQGVVGTIVTSPWMPGAWEVTQGWGQTDYDGEPEGHGFAHWHAGVDIGCDSGTVLTLPAGLAGTARAIDQDGGYGTALVVQLEQGLDVWLGHLRQRFVADGDQLRPGTVLAATNSTGNSTGPHLHFEVRPKGGRYGTDIDPSDLLLAGTSATGTTLLSTSTDQNPYNPLDPRSIGWELQYGLQQGLLFALGGGQVLLGGAMLLGGLLVAGYGLRGQNAAALQRDAGRAARGLQRRRPEPQRRSAPAPVGEAARSRVRPNLQRQLGTPNIVPGGNATRSARLDPQTGLPRYRAPRP